MSNLITPEMSNKIQEKIQKWKDKLIDSTNSNPLLDFRKNKNYVNISTPSSILFNNLTGEQPKPFPINELRTSYENTELAALLDELYSKAKSILQEKGVNSLFLALGTLTWHISKKPEEELVSPILLVPVQLQKKNRKPEYTLNAGSEEISLNSLLLKRLRDEGITLPEVELIPNLGYDKFLDQVRNTIASQTGWTVEDTAYLSLFDDKKAAMIQDLEYLQQNEDKIAANFVIQGLALEKALSYALIMKELMKKNLTK